MGGRRARGRLGASAALAAALIWVVEAFGGAAPAAAAPASHLSVVLCLDTSGSMVQSDPSGSRVAAARTLGSRLGPGDRLGLVAFSARPTVLLPLTPMGSPAARATVNKALAAVGANGATDLLAALQTGAGILAQDTRATDWHVLVLLTDGVADLPSLSTPAADTAYRVKMEAEASSLNARGWVLDTVGLGGGVDGAELARLARLGGGSYWFAPSAATLTDRLMTLYAAARAQAAAAPPPGPLPPAGKVTLSAVPEALPVAAGRAATLDLAGSSGLGAPVTVSLAGAPSGWTAPAQVVIPPGRSTLRLAVRVPARSGAARLTLGASAPKGVTVVGSPLVWHLDVRPWWRIWLQRHAARPAEAITEAVALFLLAGYAGYFLRVRPLQRARGRIEVTAPDGDSLGTLRLPRRRSVMVGGVSAPRGAVPVPWVSGEDRLFSIRVEVETVPGCWRAGLRAWRRRPLAVVYAEAEWPYHLYPGPLPQRRVDLYEATSFGAAGLTFTFRVARGRSKTQQTGMDVLDW